MKRLLVIMLLMQASGVQADVYTWTDARGIAHYTNKENEVPERYKSKAKPMHIEAVQPTPQQAAPSHSPDIASTQQAAPSPPPPAPAPPPVVSAPVSPAPAGGKASPRGRRRGNSGDVGD